MNNCWAAIIRGAVYCCVVILLISEMATAVLPPRVRLRAQITPTCSSGTSIWKFSDIYADGNIAVQGSYNCRGAFIYNISNPDAPVLASWYNPGSNQQFLEAIVIGNRGYFGSGNGGGVHIVDLTNPSSPVLLGVVNSTNGGGFNSIHEMMVWGNLLIENDNNGTNLLRVINVSNPAVPVFVRTLDPLEVNWVHAMHIRGNRMYTSGWGTSTTRGRTEIWDITNLGNASQAVPILGYIEDPGTPVTAGNMMHSSWTSEDGSYLYSAREVTNSNGSTPGDIRVYDVTNPAQPLLMNRVTMNDLRINAVTPHNPVVMGNKLYVSWYQAGLQVFETAVFGQLTRVGQYDTFQAAFTADEESLSDTGERPWDVMCGGDGFQNALPTTYNGAWAVFPFLGEDKVLVGDMTSGLLIVDVSSPGKNVVSDFDGDGKTDYAVYSPAGGNWGIEQSSNGAFSVSQWGNSTDVLVPGDYDADGRSDLAVYRPSNGTWYIYGSTAGVRVAQWGQQNDVPVAADYDNDGKTDIAVWRPANGTWYILRSSLGVQIVQWGASTDKPLVGDYEGDGKPDYAVWRPANGTWYILQSSSSMAIVANWGVTGDKPLFADFDGDGRSDIAAYRPSNGTWYIINSASNSVSVHRFGSSQDVPIPSDFDGDGKADVAVYRPDTTTWYRINSSNGAFIKRNFGQVGDSPVPSSVQPR